MRALLRRHPAGPRPPASAQARRLRLLVRSVVGSAALLLVVAAVLSARGGAPESLTFLALVAAATLGSDATLIDLRIGSQTESYTWAEVTVVVGLALLAPWHLVLLSLCIGVACAATGWSPVKTAYNTAVWAVGLTLAAGVTHAVGAPGWERPVQSAVALTAGAACFSTWNVLSVKAAIALSQGRPFGEVLRRNVGMMLLVWSGNVVLALSVLALGNYSSKVLLAVPAVLAVVYVGYRGHLRVLQEREVWQHLEATSREMGGLDEQQIAEVAVVRAATLLDADEVELCLHGPGGGPDEVHVGDAAGRRAVRSEPRQRAERFAVTTDRPLHGSPAGPDGEQTCVVVPLLGRQQQIGALRVRFRARVELSRREQQLLTTYAHALSGSLDNARLYAAVQEQAARHEQAALHDPLTGLANRTLFQRTARARLARSGASIAVLVIDLDRFKQVNDVHGHGAGDQLLCHVAEVLLGAVRPGDLVARLGGDEFAVLLEDAAGAEVTAQRLHQLLGEPVQLQGCTVTVGASIGVACSPGDASSLEELLAHADAAMYRAKQVGRAPGEEPRRPQPAAEAPQPRTGEGDGRERFIVLPRAVAAGS